MADGEICSHVGVSRPTISALRRSRLFNEELERLSREADFSAVDLRERIAKAAADGLEVLERVVQARGDEDGVPLPLQVMVAKDMLDRAGYGAVKKMDVRSIAAHLTAEQIQEMKDRLRPNGGVDGKVVTFYEAPPPPSADHPITVADQTLVRAVGTSATTQDGNQNMDASFALRGELPTASCR